MDILKPINILFLRCNFQAEKFLFKRYTDEHSTVINLTGFMPVR